ncbi:MAG: glutathione S-transferase family protein [Myxococcales bacterium FL481]|nr:MAG: glutathione S-transferase family protein [Myxococcales bacterium FL481]
MANTIRTKAMDRTTLHLVGYRICPYVQRCTIVLEEKHVPYELSLVDLFDKPGWFLRLSPLGQVPVLRVGETTLFESAVITEFVDEYAGGGLHPADPLERAVNRAWIAVASAVNVDSHELVLAPTRDTCERVAARVRDRLRKVERQLQGAFFNGDTFRLVDAAYAPVLQRLAWYEETVPWFEFLSGCPNLAAWRERLFDYPAFRRSTPPDLQRHNDALMKQLAARSVGAMPWFVRRHLER